MAFESWYRWGYDIPSPPSDNPGAVPYPDILSAQQAFLSSSRVPLDTLSLTPAVAHSIADAILAGTAAAVSDGSFDAGLQRGTSAFVLALSVNSPISSCVSGGNRTMVYQRNNLHIAAN